MPNKSPEEDEHLHQHAGSMLVDGIIVKSCNSHLHRFEEDAVAQIDPDPHFEMIAERDLMGHMRSTMDALRTGVFVDGIEVNWI